MKRIKRKLRVDRLILLLLCLLLMVSSLILIFKLLFSKKEPTVVENAQTIEKVQEIGQNASLIEMSDKFAYYISYPKFNKTNIDNKIKSIVDSKIEELKSYNSNNKYSTTSDYQGPILYINYNSYHSFKNISSVLINYEFSIPFTANNEKGVIALNFNLEKDELLSFESIFNPQAKTAFVSNIKDKLSQFQLFDVDLKDKIHDFVFSDNKLILFFNPYEISAGSNGIIKAEIDIEKIDDYFTNTQEKNNPIKIEKPKETINKNSFPIDSSKPMIALSFDDGPTNSSTVRILDILEKHQVNASFYVLGINVEGNEEVIKRSFKMGNEIGNHSYDHKSLPSLSNEDLYYEVQETNRLIKEVIGENPKSFRPPYGAYNGIVKAIDMPVVLWDVDTEDWRSRDSEEIIKQVKANAKQGSIILMHDIYQSTADAVEEIIIWLKNEGYQIVTVETLMKHKNIEYTSDKLYFSANNVE